MKLGALEIGQLREFAVVARFGRRRRLESILSVGEPFPEMAARPAGEESRAHVAG